MSEEELCLAVFCGTPTTKMQRKEEEQEVEMMVEIDTIQQPFRVSVLFAKAN